MNKEEMLMVIAMEECNEVSQRLSKALRFGLDSTFEGRNPINNRDGIEEEWSHLVALMEMLKFNCSIDEMNKKQKKVEKYLQRSVECGTLDPLL